MKYSNKFSQRNNRGQAGGREENGRERERNEGREGGMEKGIACRKSEFLVQ